MDFDYLFEIDNKHKILICKKCQYAIMLLHLKTHLKAHYLRLTLEQRCTFVAKIERYTALTKVHNDVVYLALTDPLVPILLVYFDRLRCN